MAFSKVKVGGLADDSVTAANIDDDGTGYTVGNLTNSGTLQQTGQVTLGSGGTNWTLPTARGTDKYVLQINGTTGASTWEESLTAPELSGHNFDVSGSTDDGGINAYEAPYTATGNTTNGSNSIASISVTSSGDDINDLKVGQFVSGAGIPANTVIKAISGTTITLKDNTTGADTNATATSTGTILSIQKTPGEKNGGKVTLTGTNFGVNVGDISVAITDSGGGVIANASYLSGLSGGNTIVAEWTGTEGTYSTALTSSYAGKIYFKMTKAGLASNILDTNATLTTDGSFTALSTSSQTGGDRSVAPSATSLGTYGTGRIAGGGQDSNTKLLLNFDRTGGTDIEDSSNTGGDGHEITATNAVIKASPFGDGKSAMFFDGTNDMLEVASSSDFNMGSSAFTIEWWMNYQDQTNDMIIFSQWADTNNRMYIQVKAGLDIKVFNKLSGTTTCEQQFDTNFSLNEWNHFALVRDTTLKLYLNGVEQSSTNSTALGTGNFGRTDTLEIGTYGGEANNFAECYMDEIRIVKGSAVYTGDFDVPTSRLTAITNTKLLIHSDRHGGLSPETGDRRNYISVTDVGPLKRTTSTGTASQLIDGNTTATGSDTYWFENGLTSGHLLFDFKNSAIVNKFTWIQAASTSQGQWTFSGSNDTQNTPPADSSFTPLKSTFDLVSGTSTDHTFTNTTAYRYYKLEKTGTGATNHGPYTHEIQFFNTSDLSTTFTDSSTSGHTITPTGAYHSQGHGGIAPAMTWPASLKKTGSAGVYFDGDTSHGGDRITVSPAPTHMTTQGANTTVEFWFYCTGSGHRMSLFRTPLFDKTGIGCNFLFEINENGHFKGWFLDSKGYNNTESGNNSIYYVENFQTTFPNNQWHHFTFTHTGWGGGNTTVGTHGVANVFCDGKYLAPTGTDTRNLWKNKLIDATEDNLCFGGGPTGSDTNIGSFKGYIDGIRVSDSIRYTGTSTSEWGNYDQPTRTYGAFGSTKPDVGTITLVATGSGDYTWSEVAGGTALPGTLAVGSTTHSGSGDSRTHTATITGAFTSGVSSDTTTNGILIKAQNDADATKAITLGSSGGYDGVNIIQKSTERPVLFNARRYVGTGATRDINNFGFAPDLVWVKNRDATQHHALFDTVRGATKRLVSNLHAAEDTQAQFLTAFNSDGYSIGSSSDSMNADGQAIVAWGFKAGGAPVSIANNATGVSNATNVTQSASSTSGFSITKFTGHASGGSFPHNLGGTPDWVIIKNLNDTQHWSVWHSSESTKHGFLSLSNAFTNNSSAIYPTAPSSSIISFGTDTNNGGSASHNFICYAWKAVSGVSAFGTYEGTAAAHSVNIGFKPRFLLLKNIDVSSRYWAMIDSFRVSSDTITTQLYADLNNAEDTGNAKTVVFNSTGFAFTSASTYHSINEDNQTFIYMAFA